MSSATSLIPKTYNSAAISVAALNSVMTSEEGKKELKALASFLPDSSETVIDFILVSDMAEGGSKYRAATMLIQKTAESRIRLSASIGTYVSGVGYQQPFSENTQIASDSCRALSTGDSSSAEVEISYYPLANAYHIENLQNMDAKKRCPYASAVVASISSIYKKGIPLPIDERLHWCTFQVLLRYSPGINKPLNYEKLILNCGSRGTNDLPRASDYWWTSTCVEDSSSSKELVKTFEQLADQAKGIRRFWAVPSNARSLQENRLTQTSAPAIKSSSESALKGPRIEEVDN